MAIYTDLRSSMKYLLISLFCCLAIAPGFCEKGPEEKLILSTPNQVATLCSESEGLVGGIVHPLSGLPVVACTDLVVKGAQGLVLHRVYIPAHIPCAFPRHRRANGEWRRKYLSQHLMEYYKGWQYLPQMYLEVDRTNQGVQVYVSEANGMTLPFILSGPNNSIALLPSPHYAINNASGDTPSGSYDPRNIRVTHEDNGKKFTVYAMDGTVRFYCEKMSWWKTEHCHSYLYLLEKEILPNGKVIKYHFDAKHQLTYVESLDPKERYVYASIRVSQLPGWGRRFLSSSGTTTDYSFEEKKITWEFRRSNRTERGNTDSLPYAPCRAPSIAMSA